MQDYPCSIQEMFEIELINREGYHGAIVKIEAISKDGTTLIELNPKLLKMTDG